MTRITHFEITSPSPAETAMFYSKVFGWPAEASPFIAGYHMLDLDEPGGSTGAVMDAKYRSQPVILWFDVASIDETVAAVAAAGGKSIDEKHTLPGVGQLIYVADPQRTIFGLRQPVERP